MTRDGNLRSAFTICRTSASKPRWRNGRTTAKSEASCAANSKSDARAKDAAKERRHQDLKRLHWFVAVVSLIGAAAVWVQWHRSPPPAAPANPLAAISPVPTPQESSAVTSPAATPEELVPPLEEAVPPPEEAVPPSEEAVPPSEEAVPPPEEAVPPSEEAVPPSEEAVPPLEEAVPPPGSRVADVRGLALSPDVLVAGRAVHP